MNDSLSKVIIFAAGAILGSLATWKALETKYKKLADEEIASVKEMYTEKFTPKNFEPEKFEPETFKYQEAISDFGYANAKQDSEATVMKRKPCIIAPEEYGEKEGYETESLTYYADGVLTDDQDEPIEDVDNVVGLGFESHFGEYEDDSVFIRNDNLKIDYEILAVQDNYSDINKKQRSAEVE